MLRVVRVLDPGHQYALHRLDGGGCPEVLSFVKRVGEGYPGNGDVPYAGTTTQEVLRVLIDRTEYVDAQVAHPANEAVLKCLRRALWALERRAAERHGATIDDLMSLESCPEDIPTCPTCGHFYAHEYAACARRSDRR